LRRHDPQSALARRYYSVEEVDSADEPTLEYVGAHPWSSAPSSSSPYGFPGRDHHLQPHDREPQDGSSSTIPSPPSETARGRRHELGARTTYRQQEEEEADYEGALTAAASSSTAALRKAQYKRAQLRRRQLAGDQLRGIQDQMDQGAGLEETQSVAVPAYPHPFGGRPGRRVDVSWGLWHRTTSRKVARQ
jgi:hypothetical protein